MTEPPGELVTARLRLRWLTRDEIRLAMDGDREALGARVGAHVPVDWPAPDLAEALPIIREGMESRPGADWGWVWVAIDGRSAVLVGDIGFHSPVRGALSVEVGYMILPAARGRGYATEAAAALLDWAFREAHVERVTAQIEPGNAASLRVVEKVGMRETAAEEPGFRCFERRRSDARA